MCAKISDFEANKEKKTVTIKCLKLMHADDLRWDSDIFYQRPNKVKIFLEQLMYII